MNAKSIFLKTTAGLIGLALVIGGLTFFLQSQSPRLFHMGNLKEGSIEQGRVYDNYIDKKGEFTKQYLFSAHEALGSLPSQCHLALKTAYLMTGTPKKSDPPPSDQGVIIFVEAGDDVNRYHLVNGRAYRKDADGGWVYFDNLNLDRSKIQNCVAQARS